MIEELEVRSGPPPLPLTSLWFSSTLSLVTSRYVGELSRFVRQRLRPLASKQNREDLLVLKEPIEAGKITPIIANTYPLREVPDAVRQLGETRTRTVRRQDVPSCSTALRKPWYPCATSALKCP